jgi:hypothetical protein
MAGKSKHGKHLPRSKRKGKKKAFTAPAALKPSAAEASRPATEAAKAPPAPAPKAKAPVAVAEVSNVAAELRTIGIVAGIMIVILVILALIFA